MEACEQQQPQRQRFEPQDTGKEQLIPRRQEDKDAGRDQPGARQRQHNLVERLEAGRPIHHRLFLEVNRNSGKEAAHEQGDRDIKHRLQQNTAPVAGNQRNAKGVADPQEAQVQRNEEQRHWKQLRAQRQQAKHI